jgi:Domain of unknown function (DUF5597)
MHYVPEWIKTNPAKYPRELNAYGKLLDVMSPHSTATLEAERRAFATLMHYLREIDGRERIVIMMQVENEPGSVGSVRDFSAAANKEFTGSVPQLMHVESGTWSQIYGADADERFATYATAHYINQVAEAGKAEYALPMYCNVWISYPVHALENRDHPTPARSTRVGPQ